MNAKRPFCATPSRCDRDSACGKCADIARHCAYLKTLHLKAYSIRTHSSETISETRLAARESIRIMGAG